jgi:hypothetical protein
MHLECLRERVIEARLLGVQKAICRAFELIFGQSPVCVQFRQFAKFIGKRHGALRSSALTSAAVIWSL